MVAAVFLEDKSEQSIYPTNPGLPMSPSPGDSIALASHWSHFFFLSRSACRTSRSNMIFSSGVRASYSSSSNVRRRSFSFAAASLCLRSVEWRGIGRGRSRSEHLCLHSDSGRWQEHRWGPRSLLGSLYLYSAKFGFHLGLAEEWSPKMPKS